MQVNGMNFTVGADPEIFVEKGGVIQSAFGLVQGTKYKPQPVRNGAVQVDGMALEFNIDPVQDAAQFHQNLREVQDQLAEMIGDYTFTDQVSNMFDEEYMKLQPPEATELGCDPDYNGYTLRENRKPNADGNLRTVGGHVHIGGIETKDPFIRSHFQVTGRLARIMDEQVGVYSILWDKDDERRSLYGQAGAFRPKKYGMEYRTMSNKWIFNDKIIDFIFDGVRNSLELMFDPSYEPNPEVRDIINNSDRSSKFFQNNAKADRVMEVVAA